MSNRDIIVIGGSAGATAPLKEILARLPTTIPAAIFIVLHRPAHGIGILSTRGKRRRQAAGAAGRKRHQSRRCMSRARPSSVPISNLHISVRIMAISVIEDARRALRMLSTKIQVPHGRSSSIAT